ncbi:MAG: hypothetical protein QM681_20400 [Novosphingobium sp.]
MTTEERLSGWRGMDEHIPYDTPLEIRVGRMTMWARLIPDGSENEDGSCDQWVAEYEGEHPPCWSDGACWESNDDECMSLQPTAWRLPAPPATGQGGE